MVSDAYATDERSEVFEALSDLLAPDSPDWSRKGVYAYWDRENHDLLYVGLASDVPARFAQHNGLISYGGGSKKQEIDDYFLHRSRLGLTVVIQGAAVAIHDAIVALDFTMGVRSDELIAVGEGQLIESHRLTNGRRPPWNKTGGSRTGKQWATRAPALLDILAARRSSLFVARKSLRDLASSEVALGYEAAIHAARMRATMDAHDVGRFPDDSNELTLAIRKSLMLSGGHLLDELDASDAEVVEWLRKLSDPTYWRQEAEANRHRLEEARGGTLRFNERMIADLLDAVFEEAAPPEHIAATQAIFRTDYLREEPQLPR
ncbi:MAG TPA: hypothetical protein VF101_11535 [Gaiellaceae bacterium]